MNLERIFMAFCCKNCVSPDFKTREYTIQNKCGETGVIKFTSTFVVFTCSMCGRENLNYSDEFNEKVYLN
jgi:predicted RNA-binding Zn-ribbon protein involved in translation (DUF1610 family)